MDKNTRDTFAMISAHDSLLEALYLEVFKNNPEGLSALRSDLIDRAKKPILRPDPYEQDQATEIQPQTVNTLEVFFLGLDEKLPSG